MAIEFSPNQWLADWAEAGGDITLPVASVTGLTAAEADGEDGDIRKVLFALCETVYAVWDATAAADRPAGMKIYKQTSGTSGNNVKRTFVFEFRTDSTDEDVASESDIA